MFKSIVRTVFGDPNERELSRHREVVEQINALEPVVQKLSDAELRAKTGEFKARLEQGETLDDILPEYAPGLYASISPATWEAARVQGHIYAVINQQIWPKPWGVHVIKSFADKYNLDLDTITKFEDMEPFMDAVLEGEGGAVTPYCQRSVPFYLQYHGFTEMGSGDGAGVSVRYNDPTVVNVFESPEWQAHAQMNRRWYLAGYVFMDDVPNIDETIKAELCAYDTHVEKPNQGTDLKAKYGQDWIFKNLTDPLILDTGGATATMNAICATSADPIAAMKVLEMLNTNKEVYRLLSYGIEGKHWVWVDKDLDVVSLPEGKTQSDMGYFPNTDWMFGNQFNAYYVDAAQAEGNVWEETRILNEGALVSPAMGFAFDQIPVETQIAQVSSASEYGQPLGQGLVDTDEYLDQHIQLLRNAGADDIVAEAKKQLGDWRAENA